MVRRVVIHGAQGRMGRMAVEAVNAADDLELVRATGRADDLSEVLAAESADVLVEFTHGAALAGHVAAALDAGMHVVSGTTGAPRADLAALGLRAANAGLGLLVAANFSVAMALVQRWTREASRWLPHVEIVEMHHDRKRDAPSGTALATAGPLGAQAVGPEVAGEELVAGARGAAVGEVRIHSVRLPGLLAHQEVLMANGDELLTIRHDAWSRGCFAPGLLLAIRRVHELRGWIDSLEPLLDGAPSSP